MTQLPGLLKFTPKYRTVRWGGRRIAAFKNTEPTGDHIGESWELSALPDMLTLSACIRPGRRRVRSRYRRALMAGDLSPADGG